MLISIPYTVALVFFPEDIVKLIVGYGKFTSLDIALTAEAVRYYALALPGIYISSMLTKMLMVKQNIVGMVLLMLFAIIVNVFLNYVFIFILKLGVGGVAIATSIGVYLIAFIQYLILSKHE